MVPVNMSMDARMVLAKMSFIYEREGGKRIRITRDDDVVTLINYAVESINKELCKYLDNFVELLSPSELKDLASHGANIYRGAIVPDSDDFPTMNVEKPAVVTYRGVAVAAPETQEGKGITEQHAEKPKKARRVYRGRVIED